MKGPVVVVLDELRTDVVLLTHRESRSSKSQGRVDPNQYGFFFGGVEPTVTEIALKPEAIARLEHMTLHLVEPYFERSGQHVNELFAGV